jgi:hypothetical protein
MSLTQESRSATEIRFRLDPLQRRLGRFGETGTASQSVRQSDSSLFSIPEFGGVVECSASNQLQDAAQSEAEASVHYVANQGQTGELADIKFLELGRVAHIKNIGFNQLARSLLKWISPADRGERPRPCGHELVRNETLIP